MNWLDNSAKADHPSPDKVSIDDYSFVCNEISGVMILVPNIC
jgi:hypothetical protein